MIKEKDIIVYNIQNEWIDRSLEYALCSWSMTYNRMQKEPYQRVVNILKGLIFEEALEQYLKDYNIKYDTYGKTKWYEIDRYDIGIGDYIVDAKSAFVDGTGKGIFFNKKNKKWLLDCQALWPEDQINYGKIKKKMLRKHKKRGKIIIYGFVKGDLNILPEDDMFDDDRKIISHVFWHYDWLKKSEYKESKNLGNITIQKTENKETIPLKLYGSKRDKEIIKEDVLLKDKEQVTLNDFYSLHSFKLIDNKLPKSILRFTSRSDKEIEVKPNFNFRRNKDTKEIYENNYFNVQIYNGEIYLCGFLTEDEFRAKSTIYPRYSKDIKQYGDTFTKNLGCDIQDMNRIEDLRRL